MNCYMVTQLTGAAKQELQAQLYWAAEDKYMEFTYTPEIAPCREVFKNDAFVQLSKVIEAFPLDKGLEIIRAQCYVGILNKTQTGHYALLGPKPISTTDAQALIDLLKQS